MSSFSSVVSDLGIVELRMNLMQTKGKETKPHFQV
jgi:hypothetical protein